MPWHPPGPTGTGRVVQQAELGVDPVRVCVRTSPRGPFEPHNTVVPTDLRRLTHGRVDVCSQDDSDVAVAARNFVSERLCPVFQVSNVTGENIGHVKSFLNLLQPSVRYRAASQPTKPTRAHTRGARARA